MRRRKIRLYIWTSIVLMLLSGCEYAQTNNEQASDVQTASTEETSAIDYKEDDEKEKKFDIVEASWEDGYSIVLNTYREDAEKQNEYGLYWDSFDEIPKIPNVEGAMIEMEFYTQFGPFAFMLKDLDGNDIPELFICRATEDFTIGVIYHVFTWQDGKTIELLSNLGYRNGICTICQDNLLVVESSGTSTDYGNTVFYLAKNSTELSVAEQFYAIQSENDHTRSDFFWLSADGEKTPITEEDYVAYKQKYIEQEGLKYIEGTQENIDHLSDLWSH